MVNLKITKDFGYTIITIGKKETCTSELNAILSNLGCSGMKLTNPDEYIIEAHWLFLHF